MLFCQIIYLETSLTSSKLKRPPPHYQVSLPSSHPPPPRSFMKIQKKKKSDSPFQLSPPESRVELHLLKVVLSLPT